MPRKSMPTSMKSIGIDPSKTTFHLIGLDSDGGVVLRERVSRAKIAARLSNVPRCLIGIEAGMATHYVARELAALCHDVKQVTPAYAKPFRQVHKNDYRDTLAVAEAVQRPTTLFVPAKTDAQFDLQALHRLRTHLVSERTAVINQIRGFLLERGIAVRQGHHFLRRQLPDILGQSTDVISSQIMRILKELVGDWRRLDERIDAVSGEIQALAHSDADCQHLMSLPGVGPITANAMVAAIGSGAAFTKGRNFAA